MRVPLTIHPHEGPQAGLWHWSWEPSVLIGLALISLGYLLLTGPLRTRIGLKAPVPLRTRLLFLGGNAVVFIALVSPLDYISDYVLFSAHMVQHILMLGFAPVLWLLGLPDGLMNGIFRWQPLRVILRDITHPLAAFLIFNGVLLFWHIPSLYNAALEQEPLHIAMHLSFMAAAVIGWWPIFGNFPEAAPRASLPVQLLYLFLMMFPSTAMAAWMTLTPAILYPFYGSEPFELGLTPYADQQLAGLIMWIPGNALFFAVLSRVFFNWYNRNSREEWSVTASDSPADALVSIQEE